MAEQARSEKSETSLGAEVLVVGMAKERALRHGVIWRKTSHGTDRRERLHLFVRHHLGQVPICFPIHYPVLRIPIRKIAGRSGSGSH